MRGGGGRGSEREKVDGGSGGSSLSGHPFPPLDTETGSGNKVTSE